MIATSSPQARDHAPRGLILSPAAGTARYAKLRADVTAAGILDRDYASYGVVVAAVLAGMALSLYFVIRLPLSAPLALWAALFAFCAVQACGLVHDAGHRAIFRSTTANDTLGEALAMLVAMGFRSWRVQHNAHHAHTNREGEDPDLDVPLHAFTRRQFERERGPLRCVRRYQAALFIPMRVFVVFSRRLVEVKYLRSQRLSLGLVLRAAVLLFGVVVWFGAPFLLFPLAKAVFVLLIVHGGMGFYLSNVFAPNHKGMPQLGRDDPHPSFVEQQIITSRNITPGWLTDRLYFGLNYQIEHHLFPTCPRRKLKRITPYVLTLCQETGLTYTQAGVLASTRLILTTLNQVASQPLRPSVP